MRSLEYRTAASYPAVPADKYRSISFGECSRFAVFHPVKVGIHDDSIPPDKDIFHKLNMMVGNELQSCSCTKIISEYQITLFANRYGRGIADNTFSCKRTSPSMIFPNESGIRIETCCRFSHAYHSSGNASRDCDTTFCPKYLCPIKKYRQFDSLSPWQIIKVKPNCFR